MLGAAALLGPTSISKDDSRLLDQAPVHFKNGQRKEDKTKKQEITGCPKQGEIDVSKAESPCEIGKMGERKDEGKLLSPRGKIFKGEKGSAKKKHGRDK